MKSNYRYYKSTSAFAIKRRYKGYVSTPGSTDREWFTNKAQGEDFARQKNQEMELTNGSERVFLEENPGIISRVISLIRTLAKISLKFEDLVAEIEERAAALTMRQCLQEYYKHIKERYALGKVSQSYVETVSFWMNKLCKETLDAPIVALKSNLVKEEVKAFKRKDGKVYSLASLHTARSVYQSAVTVIAKIPLNKNPWDWDDFTYIPKREYLSPEESLIMLQHWYKNERGLFAYFLHRFYGGRRHAELVGLKVNDNETGKEKRNFTILWKHLHFNEGYTLVTKTKPGPKQIFYWPPAMCAWLKKITPGNPDAPLLPINPITGKPLSQASIENRLRESWYKCFGDSKYKRNWLRHTCATYACAVLGVYEASRHIGNSPTMLHKHYDGVGTEADAIKYFNSPPDGEEVIDIRTWWQNTKGKYLYNR